MEHAIFSDSALDEIWRGDKENPIESNAKATNVFVKCVKPIKKYVKVAENSSHNFSQSLDVRNFSCNF